MSIIDPNSAAALAADALSRCLAALGQVVSSAASAADEAGKAETARLAAEAFVEAFGVVHRWSGTQLSIRQPDGSFGPSVDLKGGQGGAGATGPSGPKGDTGLAGPAGATGPAGPSGALSINGSVTVGHLPMFGATNQLVDSGSSLTGFSQSLLALADLAHLKQLLALTFADIGGALTVSTQTPGTNTTAPASTAFVTAALAALVGSAPDLLNTLQEIDAQLASDESVASALATTVAGKLAKASNLADLPDKAAARTALQLGAVALMTAINSTDIADATALGRSLLTATGAPLVLTLLGRSRPPLTRGQAVALSA